MVLPKAKKRGMKVYAWYEDVFSRDVPNVGPLTRLGFLQAGLLIKLRVRHRIIPPAKRPLVIFLLPVIRQIQLAPYC